MRTVDWIKTLEKTLLDLDKQIEVVKEEAKRMGVEPAFQLRDTNGSYILPPLLVARTNVLLRLQHLKEKR